MSKKLIILTVAALMISACGTTVELPANEGEGSDYMRESPCVCTQLDYNGRGFKWVG